MIASLIFSFLLDAATVNATKGTLGALRVVWFGLAFTCIGLGTRFSELVSMEGGRPAGAFLVAQAANVIWTLLLAYLLFGGILFSVPTLRNQGCVGMPMQLSKSDLAGSFELSR